MARVWRNGQCLLSRFLLMYTLYHTPSLMYNGYRVFPRGKERPGRDADPSPAFSAVVMKWYSYTSTPSIGRKTCTEPQCLYKVAL
jgi:hypothetical protein